MLPSVLLAVSSFFLPAIVLGKGFNHHIGDAWGILGPDLDILHGSSPVSVEHTFITRALVFIRSRVQHAVYVSAVYLKVMPSVMVLSQIPVLYPVPQVF